MQCMFVGWEHACVVQYCVQELGPGSRPLPYKRTRMPHLSMFVMLYLEKNIPQPPPESVYINRVGI